MRLPRIRELFGQVPPGAVAAAARPAMVATLEAPSSAAAGFGGQRSPWSPERLEVVDLLWGKGFQFPGGEIETLHLAKPMGLSAASSLLLLGAGSGGPPCCIANSLGGWVTGFESDPCLVAAALDRSIRGGLGRRAQIETWDPASPFFERNQYHHGLALEPLKQGLPEPTLAALSMALKPAGQFVLLETVADGPLDASDPVVAGWRRLEGRRLDMVPGELAITRVLGRLGFDVRIVEDLSQRHMQQAVVGWRRAVRGMQHARPTAREAACLIQEAELWLLRMKLFRGRQLRLVRWHAILRS
jgi:hypothetical protein